MTTKINGTNTAASPAITGADTDTGLSFGTDTVNINTGGVTRATVDSSGNLGIGTTSPEDLLHIKSGKIRIENTIVSNNDSTISYDNQEFIVDVDPNNARGSSAFQVKVDGVFGLTVDDNRKLLVGTTSGSNFSNNVAEFLNTNADAAVGVRSTYGASNQNYITFQYGGGPTACGGIRRDGTNNSPEFFSSSDRRIKTNILDMDNTLDKINQLSLKKFDFKDGSGSGIGLIAQDLVSIFPNKVKKDASDDGTGDTVPDGVDPWTVGHNFTYELLKAVQELSAKVETLETEKTQMQTDLTALTARVAALEAG